MTFFSMHFSHALMALFNKLAKLPFTACTSISATLAVSVFVVCWYVSTASAPNYYSVGFATHTTSAISFWTLCSISVICLKHLNLNYTIHLHTSDWILFFKSSYITLFMCIHIYFKSYFPVISSSKQQHSLPFFHK